MSSHVFSTFYSQDKDLKVEKKSKAEKIIDIFCLRVVLKNAKIVRFKLDSA